MGSRGKRLTCTLMLPSLCGQPAVWIMLCSMPPDPDGYRHWRAVPRCSAHNPEQHVPLLRKANPALMVAIMPVPDAIIYP